MGIEIRTTKQGIDWERVAEVLHQAGLSHDDAETQKLVFERSYAVAFAYDGNLLIGCGRALSDGIRQAAIYNIAVDETYRGRQVGRAVIESLLEQVKGCIVILYTHPQTIALYEKFGFRRQKTGFVKLDIEPDKMKWMENEGFFLPEGYRFGDNFFENIASPIDGS
jgi:ribosomal protein S18 acetylase RimI-like enzyme